MNGKYCPRCDEAIEDPDESCLACGWPGPKYEWKPCPHVVTWKYSDNSSFGVAALFFNRADADAYVAHMAKFSDRVFEVFAPERFDRAMGGYVLDTEWSEQ